jgi:hypothetical protein
LDEGYYIAALQSHITNAEKNALEISSDGEAKMAGFNSNCSQKWNHSTSREEQQRGATGATWCISNENIKEQPRTINAGHCSQLHGIVKVSIAYPYQLILPIIAVPLLETRSVPYLLLLLRTTDCLEG